MDCRRAETFAILLQNIKLFTDYINIDCNEDRLFIQTMDSSKISILEITIPKTWFASYSCPIPIIFGINSGIFNKILSSRDKYQMVFITYKMEQEDTLFVHMESLEKTIFDRNFEVPLIDISYEAITIPVIDYQAEISLPSHNFALLINQLRGFGETLEILCNVNRIEMISKSLDQGKMSVPVKIDDLSGYAIEEDKELCTSFSLSNLHVMCSFSKISKDVEIRMTDNLPLFVAFDNEELTVHCFLAPRISEDIL